MDEIVWYYPETMDELRRLLRLPGVIPHGGGTAILRRGFSGVRGLISLDHLELKYIRESSGLVSVGAAISLTRVAAGMRNIDPDSILVKCCGEALPPSLRNRITPGGSIASFPIWSDLVGPLVALGAEIVLVGENEGIVSVTDYVKDPSLRKNTLITEVRFKNEKWKSHYFRETRTSFDYPAFNIAILLKSKPDFLVNDIRIIVVGTRNRLQRLEKIEEKIRGKKIPERSISRILQNPGLDFSDRKARSSSYLAGVAGVALERGLSKLLRS